MSGGPAELLLRDVQGPSELRACQALQRRTWGITEDGYLMPVSVMAAAQKVGGVVLGAFRGGRLLGFSFAYLGRLPDGELTLFSQLAAVDPEVQRTGVGTALKLEQRRRAQLSGLGSVSWTFDPLQARNAAFNLARLGARSVAFEVDLYGPRTDALHAGLATDRLLVRWRTSTAAPRGLDQPFSDGLELIIADRGVVSDLRPPHGERLHLAIPRSITEVRAKSEAQALAWQRAVRSSFQAALAAGYEACGFAAGPDSGRYLLERRR